MRVGHEILAPWLENRGMQYVHEGTRVYFELREDLRRYTYLSQGLCEEIALVNRDFKHRLLALSLTSARNVRQPLSQDEIENVAKAGLTLIL